MISQRHGVVLVVDDEPVIRMLLRHTLEIADYTVLGAADGVEAIVVLKDESHRVSAVISDITMPRMNGLVLVDHAHRVHPTVPVVLTSGMHNADAIPRPIHEMITGFLEKPYSPSSVVGAIERAVGKPAEG